MDSLSENGAQFFFRTPKVKKGDTPRSELQNVAQNTLKAPSKKKVPPVGYK